MVSAQATHRRAQWWAAPPLPFLGRRGTCRVPCGPFPSFAARARGARGAERPSRRAGPALGRRRPRPLAVDMLAGRPHCPAVRNKDVPATTSKPPPAAVFAPGRTCRLPTPAAAPSGSTDRAAPAPPGARDSRD